MKNICVVVPLCQNNFPIILAVAGRPVTFTNLQYSCLGIFTNLFSVRKKNYMKATVKMFHQFNLTEKVIQLSGQM